MPTTEEAGSSPGDILTINSASFYADLGLHVEISQKTLRPVWPRPSVIRRKWLKKIAETHPLVVLHAEDDDWPERRFRSVMEAGLTLLDEDRAEAYHACLEAQGPGGWAKHPMRRPYTVTPLPDWVCILGQDLAAEALSDRGEHDTTIDAARALDCGALPTYIPAERFEPAGVDELLVVPVLESILDVHANVFFRLCNFLRDQPRGICFTFRNAMWKSKGAYVLGQARTVSEAERAHMPGTDCDRPYGEIRLALPYWLAADDGERARVLFHQLRHFAVDGGALKILAHDVESFADEISAFGVTDEATATLIAAALTRKDTAERLEEYGIMPDDQLVLFRRYLDEAVPLAEAS